MVESACVVHVTIDQEEQKRTGEEGGNQQALRCRVKPVP